MLYFLSGLPRSGSTVLAAILNQNPQTHVTTTSGLVFALDGLANTWHSTPLLNDGDPNREKLAKSMRALTNGFYDTDKPIVIDKSRGWPIPVIMSAMTQVLGRKPKIVATVRSVPDCMASFIRVAKPENLDDFIAKGELVTHLKASYQTLQAGYAYEPECFLFVEYDDLLTDPKKQMDRIHEFLELPPFEYNFDHIDGSSVKEDDEVIHKYAGMHDVKPKLERQHNQHPKDVLGHHYAQFCQPEFWLPAPRTLPVIDDLDLQLAASMTGNFEEGQRIADKLENERSDDHRAAFNRGWYELRKGNLRRGYELMHRGRKVGVFGDGLPNSAQPEWDGRTRGTVLLKLEGGLGDQIHQIRYAEQIAKRGNKVIVSASGSLVSLFQENPYVAAVVQHGAEYGVYHDFWMYGMSAPLYLGTDCISGTAYIDCSKMPINRTQRIGLRWSGNKAFETQHHKLFPPQQFFEAVYRSSGFEYISLQRDADLEFKPDWVKDVKLDTWHDTRNAIASCDLVISSCTSVSHLSAAMGVPTWVIVPVMSYYLYAEPKSTCIYYDSMTLFRQQVYGDWSHPFKQISEHELLSR